MSNHILGTSVFNSRSENEYYRSNLVDILSDYSVTWSYDAIDDSTLKEFIKHIPMVNVKTMSDSANTYTRVVTQRLFIPSETELFGDDSLYDYYEGKHFDYFKNNIEDSFKKRNSYSSFIYEGYWTRTCGGDSYEVRTVSSLGNNGSDRCYESLGIVPCLIFVI